MDDKGKAILLELLNEYGYAQVISEIASKAEDDGHEDLAVELDDLSFEAP